jgi:hypothetical protein
MKLKIGDVLVSTLRRKQDGLDAEGLPYFFHSPQCHAYQVTAIAGPQTVIIRELHWQINTMSGRSYARPVASSYAGAEMMRFVQQGYWNECIEWADPMIEIAAPYHPACWYPAELVRAQTNERQEDGT